MTEVAPVPVPVSPTRRGGGLIASGLVAIVVGIVLGVVSVVLLGAGAVGAVQDQLTAPVFSTPGAQTMSLGSGRYLLFEPSDSSTSLGPDNVLVQAADGTSVPVTRGTGGHEEVTRLGDQYVAFAGFDSPGDGSYVVTVKGDPSSVLVARGVVGAVADTVGWGFGIAGAGLLFLLGLILLIVGLMQRSKSRPPTPAGAYQQPSYGQPAYGQPTYQQPTYQQPVQPALPVAGWYPDPDPTRPGGRRYWDGQAWTQHTA